MAHHCRRRPIPVELRPLVSAAVIGSRSNLKFRMGSTRLWTSGAKTQHEIMPERFSLSV
jgi:hypothetical protein